LEAVERAKNAITNTPNNQSFAMFIYFFFFFFGPLFCRRLEINNNNIFFSLSRSFSSFSSFKKMTKIFIYYEFFFIKILIFYLFIFLLFLLIWFSLSFLFFHWKANFLRIRKILISRAIDHVIWRFWLKRKKKTKQNKRRKRKKKKEGS